MQKWKVCLTFESEGNILMESKLYILEDGRYNPSILLAFKIARYFGMAIEDIFIYEEGTE